MDINDIQFIFSESISKIIMTRVCHEFYIMQNGFKTTVLQA